MDDELIAISSRLLEISKIIQPEIENIVNDYGLKCINFSVSAIDIADNGMRKNMMKLDYRHILN